MKKGSTAVETLSDGEIVEMYWRRDEQAIRETDNKYGKYLQSVAFNIVNDECDRDECLSDTYVGAWNSIPPERPVMLKAFLTTIMRRVAISKYRAGKRQKRVTSELSVSLSEVIDFIEDGEDPYTEHQTKELGELITSFVRSLSKRRMYIFMSRYYVARPISEIASLLGCSESTVHKEIAAIKRDLKEKLESEGYYV